MKTENKNRFVMVRSLLLCCFFSLWSCGNDEMGDFQQNDPFPEYRLFDIFDDYPSLEEGFKSLDQKEFNVRLADAVNSNMDSYLSVSDFFVDIIKNDKYPLQNITDRSAKVLRDKAGCLFQR